MSTSRPSIYYACGLPVRAGGELVNWQHVSGLRKLGYRAFALLDPNSRIAIPKRPYSVPMVHWGDHIRFTEDDWLVVPEVFPPESFEKLSRLPCRIVIHNQNPFYTFRGFPTLSAMNEFPLSGGLCCSKFTRDMLSTWGSKIDWQVVRPKVLEVFASAPQLEKKRQIAYMPRKRSQDVALLRGVFSSMYPEHAGVPWVEIKDMSRMQVANVLSESLIFLSMSKNEGLGLPPLEAMASGCLVCGFHGEGGKEYASEHNGWWVAEGDVTNLSHGVNAALTASDDELKRRRQVGRETSSKFNESRFVEDLSMAWRRLLNSEASRFSTMSPSELKGGTDAH